MAVGKAITKDDIDRLAASYARNMTQVLNDEGYAEFANAIMAIPDATLLAAPYNYAQADIDNLKAFINEMNEIIAAYNTANNARTFARRLYGLYNG